MDLKHFTHHHSLAFHQVPPSHEVQCSGCKNPGSGNTYACWQCNFFLHDQCYRATRSLNHHTHPNHPLTLVPHPTYPSGSFICNSCNLGGTGMSYSCSECEFDIHVHCAYNTLNNTSYPPPPPPPQPVAGAPQPYPPQPGPALNTPQVQVYPPQPGPVLNSPHIYPPQPGTALNNPQVYPPQPGPAQTSPQLVYPPQPSPSPSPTQNNPNVYPPQPGPSPTQNNPNVYPPQPQPQPPPPPVGYPTSQTNPSPSTPTPPTDSTVVHTAAPPTQPTNTTGQPNQTNQDPTHNPSKIIKHFSHPHHALKPMEVDRKEEKICSGCECYLKGPSYLCTESQCRFCLHESCFDSPLEINHGSHLQHPLKLVTSPPYEEGFTCNACLKDGKAFAYTCAPCGYDLHVDCVQWPETVTRSDHKHPMKLYYSSAGAQQAAAGHGEAAFVCGVCKNPVHEMAWMYLCRECDFGTHLECIATGVSGATGGGGGQTQEELLTETELRFAMLQLLLQTQAAQAALGLIG